MHVTFTLELLTSIFSHKSRFIFYHAFNFVLYVPIPAPSTIIEIMFMYNRMVKLEYSIL